MVGQLSEVAERAFEESDSDLRVRLFRVLAQLCETAAMMSWDRGLEGVAQQYYIMAFRVAQLGSDPCFAANTLREGWAYAALGRSSAFDHSCTSALQIIEHLTPTQEPHWLVYLNAAEIHGTIGGRYLELAHQDKSFATTAAAFISDAVDLRDDSRLRSLALDRLGLAECLLLQGQVDKAVRQAERVANSVGAAGPGRVMAGLEQFLRHASPRASQSRLTDLKTAMRHEGRAP